MRIAIAMLVVFLGSPVFASAADGDRVSPSVSDSATPASSAAANSASATVPVSPNALVIATLVPDAPPISDSASAAVGTTELKISEPAPAGTLPITPDAAVPSVGNAFVTNNSLTSIHALMSPPAAIIKLKPAPRTHSFFDSRNRLGFATLGASLTADALSTQKGLAYPGFMEMNPIARPFVQSRLGAAAYNAGSFGLMAGVMYWAHKTEHHKLERILPFAVGSWEGLLSARNYHLIANRAK